MKEFTQQQQQITREYVNEGLSQAVDSINKMLELNFVIETPSVRYEKKVTKESLLVNCDIMANSSINFNGPFQASDLQRLKKGNCQK